MALIPAFLERDKKFKSAETIIKDRFPKYIQKAKLTEVFPAIEKLKEDALDELCKYFIPNFEFLKTKEEKIEALKRVFEFRHYKGTLYGYKLYYSFFLKREVYKASPPYKAFISPTYTDEERKNFEKYMPEVRVYPFRKKGVKKSLFVGDILQTAFPLQTDALLRIGDRVELFDPLNNQTQLLNYYVLEKSYINKIIKKEIEVRLKGKKHGIFFDDPIVGFLVNQCAYNRLYRVILTEPYKEEIERKKWLSLKPSLSPIKISYEEERELGKAHGFYLSNRYKEIYHDKGGSFIGHFICKSDAESRIYKKFKLFNPERLIFSNRKIFSFLSALRIGVFPTHTAELYIDGTGRAKPKQTFLSSFPGALVSSDASQRIKDLVKVGKECTRVADKVLCNFTNHRVIRVGEFLLGKHRLGEYILGVF